MNRIILILGLLAVMLVYAAYGSADSAESAFREAVDSYLAGKGYKSEEGGYEMELVDLTGDGTDDALVLLTSPEWCGTGGCTLLVFKGEPGGKAEFVSATTLVWGPITISKEKTNGWRDLIFELSGGGAKPGYVVLKYDGKGYPGNASDAPYLISGKPEEGQTVFDEP